MQTQLAAGEQRKPQTLNDDTCSSPQHGVRRLTPRQKRKQSVSEELHLRTILQVVIQRRCLERIERNIQGMVLIDTGIRLYSITDFSPVSQLALARAQENCVVHRIYYNSYGHFPTPKFSIIT